MEDLPRRARWPLIVNSALLYALAYNLIFLLQELFLVIPKAIYGLQPTLYHNNHRWMVSDPIADLLQGCGALTILICGLSFVAILFWQAKSRSQLKLFSIWMAYHGLTQSLFQFAFVILNSNGDVADALNYMGMGFAARVILVIAAAASLVLVGLLLARPLLEIASVSMAAATPGDRTKSVLQIGLLPAFIGVILIIPFRIPPLDQMEGPITMVLPLLCTLAFARWAKEVEPVETAANQKINWIAVTALIGLLATFRLLLAPGVEFF
jgi:hypothetical protein